MAASKQTSKNIKQRDGGKEMYRSKGKREGRERERELEGEKEHERQREGRKRQTECLSPSILCFHWYSLLFPVPCYWRRIVQSAAQTKTLRYQLSSYSVVNTSEYVQLNLQ